MDDNRIRIAVGITGSIHKIEETVKIIKHLKACDYEVVVFVSTSIKNHQPSMDLIESIVDQPVISTISETEPFGPKKYFDVMLISPLTGNSLSKLANAQTDNAVLMAAKGLLRNNNPVVLAISTNDALGLNGNNLMKLLVTKNIYFVPFYQDDPIEKPNSLIADYDKVHETIIYALKGKQLQPIILARSRDDKP
jgi:dipicolinate synthase subunit B